MEIKYLGHSAFTLQSGDNIILFDPYDPDFVGLSWKDINADVVCISHDHKDHNYIKGVKGDPFVVTEAGEFEHAGVQLQGITAFHDGSQGEERGQMTLFTVRTEGLCVGHFGNLGHVLNDEQQEEIGQIDILIIPIDGVSSLGSEEASNVIAQVEPAIVIPMHYNVPGTKTEEWKFEELDDFLKEMGVEEKKSKESLKIDSRAKLPEKTEIVVLKAENN